MNIIFPPSQRQIEASEKWRREIWSDLSDYERRRLLIKVGWFDVAMGKRLPAAAKLPLVDLMNQWRIENDLRPIGNVENMGEE